MYNRSEKGPHVPVYKHSYVSVKAVITLSIWLWFGTILLVLAKVYLSENTISSLDRLIDEYFQNIIYFTPISFVLVIAFLIGLFVTNKIKSPFEQNRQAIRAVTIAGKINFNSKGPFIRVLIYPDGIETRFFFQCFFIPYDKLQLKHMTSSLIRAEGIQLKTNLPGIPKKMDLLTGEQSEEILTLISVRKEIYLGKIKGTPDDPWADY